MELLKITVKELFTGAKLLILLLFLFLSLLIIWFGVDIYNKLSESQESIIVSATSEVYAKPDLALTVFSVLSEAKTVAGAMEENTKKMNNVISFVKSQGVQDKDLKTTSFNIYPKYEWQPYTLCVVPCPSGRSVLVGYEVRQSLEVKIRELDKVGVVIQGATEQGVNELGNLQFVIENEDALKENARKQAIDEAKEKAKTLAAQLGIRLVRIIQFSENAPAYYPYSLEASMADGKGGGAPQIETGENKISVTVSITYQIR